MIIELNIGLNINGRRNSLADCSERAVQAIAYLNQRFNKASTRREISEYEGPYGELRLEDSLIARVDASNGNRDYVMGAIYQLALDLEQECIAVKFYDDTGILVGPSAGKWGAFDINYFKDYEPGYAAARRAAA